MNSVAREVKKALNEADIQGAEDDLDGYRHGNYYVVDEVYTDLDLSSLICLVVKRVKTYDSYLDMKRSITIDSMDHAHIVNKLGSIDDCIEYAMDQYEKKNLMINVYLYFNDERKLIARKNG